MFEGFLPARAAARRKRLAVLADELRTIVCYEAPHRIRACLADLVAVLGPERDVAIAREMTKLHETLYRGRVDAVRNEVDADPNAVRGEIVLVIAGAPARDTSMPEREALAMLPVLRRHVTSADAIRIAAEITGVKRNRLYRLAHDTDG